MNNETEHFIIFTDGGARGTPGPSACAAWFPQLGEGISQHLGVQTNNFAEYSGLILGLKYAIEAGHTDVQCFADSELLVKQVQGVYQVKSETLRSLWETVQGLIGNLTSFSICHVYRVGNKEADALCNKCMDAVGTEC